MIAEQAAKETGNDFFLAVLDATDAMKDEEYRASSLVSCAKAAATEKSTTLFPAVTEKVGEIEDAVRRSETLIECAIQGNRLKSSDLAEKTLVDALSEIEKMALGDNRYHLYMKCLDAAIKFNCRKNCVMAIRKSTSNVTDLFWSVKYQMGWLNLTSREQSSNQKVKDAFRTLILDVIAKTKEAGTANDRSKWFLNCTEISLKQELGALTEIVLLLAVHESAKIKEIKDRFRSFEKCIEISIEAKCDKGLPFLIEHLENDFETRLDPLLIKGMLSCSQAAKQLGNQRLALDVLKEGRFGRRKNPGRLRQRHGIRRLRFRRP